MQTIGQTAIDGGFSILVDAINFIDANTDADLLGAVTSPGDLTVFAPTNAAFGQLAADLGFGGDTTDTAAVTTFLVENVDVGTLRAVVEYHVLPGGRTKEELDTEGTFATLLGPNITIDGPTLVDNEPDLIDPSIVVPDIMATNGIVHAIDNVLLPIDLPGNDAKTFTEIVLESGTGFDTNNSDFDLLREAVVAADLADDLNNPDADLTVFAPNDAAFISLAQTLGFQGDGEGEGEAFDYIVDSLRLLSKGASPIPLLETILLYHVADESLQASQVLTGAPIDTLAGAQISPNGAELVDLDPDLPNPTLIATDIQAANGVLHVLDGVLIPADILQSDGSGKVDFVIGEDRSEVIRTGRDNDFIDGKGGADVIWAGVGDDVVLGGDGRDLIRGGAGDDHILGENGADAILAGRGSDMADGGKGADIIFGGSGDDTIDGGNGRDKLHGGSGDDMVMGGMGRDILNGNSGNDILTGGHGRDKLSGGSGNDILEGGTGRDILAGGRGEDTFVFQAGDARDVIVDFKQGEDLIDLTAFGFEDGFDDIAHNIRDRGHDTEIKLEHTRIVLEGIDAHDLSADDFLF
ncbi:MAG: fasciclin domain-containing protein [Pseudomonadota bacterium]